MSSPRKSDETSRKHSDSVILKRRFMKISSVLVSSFILLLAQRTLASEVSPSHYNRNFAVGGAYTINKKAQGTDDSYYQHSGEVFGYSYYQLDSQFIIRPGIRFGYTPSQEPSSNRAGSITITESDFKPSGEISLVWSKYKILPALTLGGGAVFRSTRLINQPHVNSTQSSISDSSALTFVQGQLSVIIPIPRVPLEAAPFVRYTHIFSDWRVGWYLGLEASVAVF